MDSKISNLIELSYSKGKYQGVFLLFCFLTWLNCNIFHVTIHKLEYFPLIYSDPPSTEKYEDYDSNICTKLEKNDTFYYKDSTKNTTQTREIQKNPRKSDLKVDLYKNAPIFLHKSGTNT